MKKILYLLLIISSSIIYSQNLVIGNNSFDNGFNNWDTGSWGPEGSRPLASFQIDEIGNSDDSSLRVRVTKDTDNGTGSKVFLKRHRLQLKKKKTYELAFWIRSKYYDDEILVTVYSGPDTGSKEPWGAAVNRAFQFVGDGKWYKITHRFKAVGMNTDLDVKNVSLLFGFDKRKGTFWIDDVSLTRVE